MPKSFFTVDKCVSLHDLKPGASIHVLGVCGVAMAQLAVALAQQGYQVSGSDREFFEPMASLLRKSPVKIYEGYDEKNISAAISLAVIGNSISYGHPEVEVIEKENIPYTFFSKALCELIIDGNHSIVVTGTHGKSTTTSLFATTLKKLGEDPSYFIGGQVNELPESFHRSSGHHSPSYSVVEGDEYDSAFFAKVPKFDFYKPDSLVITSIEYDHADIYPDLGAIIEVFDKLVLSRRAGQEIFCCVDSKVVRDRVPQWRDKSGANIITYGSIAGVDADIKIVKREQQDGFQSISVESTALPSIKLTVPLTGNYNALNAVAVYGVLCLRGFTPGKISEALRTFKGLKRRQEIRYNKNEITLIEDFAHHPTAVKETLQGVREAYPGRGIWALFDPRSNTSRRKVFYNAYREAFAGSNHVILSEVVARAIDAGQDLMDTKDLVADMRKDGANAFVIGSAKEIQEKILSEVKPGDVIVMMSNGAFGGLPAMLQKALEERYG